MDEQREIVDMGGTMRLGVYPAKLEPGSVVARAYGEELVYERHRHRYEVNNRYRTKLEEAGLHCSGTSPDDRLVEYVELAPEVHPFFVATQAHPEFKSRPNRPHPLFAAFVRAAAERAEGRAHGCPSTRSTRSTPSPRTCERASRSSERGPSGPARSAESGRGVSGFRIVGSETVADVGFLKLTEERVAAPDGEALTRYVVRHLGAVVAVPVDETGEGALLVRQYRVAPDRDLLEVPAGKRDVDGESPEETARRELEEEIGRSPGGW